MNNWIITKKNRYNINKATRAPPQGVFVVNIAIRMEIPVHIINRIYKRRGY